MQTSFRIPKQTDRDIISALVRVAARVTPSRTFSLQFTIPGSPRQTELPAETSSESNNDIEFVLRENSRLLDSVYLKDSKVSHHAIRFFRDHSHPTDRLEIGPDNYINQVSESERAPLCVSLIAVARKEFLASDAESSLDGLGNSEWTRYLASQRDTLKALQIATQQLLTDAARRNDEFEVTRRQAYEKLEQDLRAKTDLEREKLESERKHAREEMEANATALQKRVEAFNTKEGRYVARQKQDDQIKQVTAWIEKWDLTASTNEKRKPIRNAYVAAIFLTAAFTVGMTWLSVDILKGETLVTLSWWQWLLLSLKTVLPFAACTTFIVYFIKWSSAWARQHADEELRNRARLIDIGRSGWLLEAVRDAQEHNKELPPELVRELSRNLFATTSIAESDLHPQAATELLMQGLNSLRVRGPDGSEVEAKRDKRK